MTDLTRDFRPESEKLCRHAELVNVNSPNHPNHPYHLCTRKRGHEYWHRCGCGHTWSNQSTTFFHEAH